MVSAIAHPSIKTVDELYKLILRGSSLTWETIIYDIVEKEKMDAWNIDVLKLADKYLDAIKRLKLIDFRLSGKVLLAAALLVRMKSDQIDFEKMFGWKRAEKVKRMKIIEPLSPDELELVQAIPLPRERRVTLEELVGALRKAIVETKKRKRLGKGLELSFDVEKLRRSDFQLVDKIREVLDRVKVFINKFRKKKVEFQELIPSVSREDVVWTFLPLLYLANNGEVILEQKDCLKDLYIVLPDESIVGSITLRKK